MNDSHGQTQGIRGSESLQDVRTDSDGSAAIERVSTGIGNQPIAAYREGSSPGVTAYDTIGGVLDQLIDDAERQKVKSQECIDWYKQELQEYEAKLENLRKLKQLQLQQQQQQQQLEQSNDSDSGESLAE